MLRSVSLVTLLSLILAGCANPPGNGEQAAIPKSKVETGVKLARIQEQEGHLQKALKMYESLHQTAPQNAEICHRMMVVYSRLDHSELADQFFRKADGLRPDHADLYADYGYACYLRGELKEAETWLQKAHQLRPSEERITGNLALVLAAQGRVKESLTYYRQYLDDAQAQANVGYALTQRGDFAAARDYYTKALELDPRLKSAQHALLQLAEWEEASKKAPTPTNHPKPPQIQPAQNSHWQPTGTASRRS